MEVSCYTRVFNLFYFSSGSRLGLNVFFRGLRVVLWVVLKSFRFEVVTKQAANDSLFPVE